MGKEERDDRKDKKQESFEENFHKLEKFSVDLQSNDVTIDELVPRMKEALQSVKVCKQILQYTKSQLKEVSAEFDELVREEER